MVRQLLSNSLNVRNLIHLFQNPHLLVLRERASDPKQMEKQAWAAVGNPAMVQHEVQLDDFSIQPRLCV